MYKKRFTVRNLALLSIDRLYLLLLATSERIWLEARHEVGVKASGFSKKAADSVSSPPPVVNFVDV